MYNKNETLSAVLPSTQHGGPQFSPRGAPKKLTAQALGRITSTVNTLHHPTHLHVLNTTSLNCTVCTEGGSGVTPPSRHLYLHTLQESLWEVSNATLEQAKK